MSSPQKWSGSRLNTRSGKGLISVPLWKALKKLQNTQDFLNS